MLPVPEERHERYRCSPACHDRYQDDGNQGKVPIDLWRILSRSPKWQQLNNPDGGSFRKRSTVDAEVEVDETIGSTDQIPSFNVADSDDEDPIPRPIGRKKAKSIASGSGGFASASASPRDEIGRAMVEQLRAFNLQEQERLKLKEKELKLKEQETEMKVMQTDPGTFIPRQIGRQNAKSIASGSGGSAYVSASPRDKIGQAMVEQLWVFNLQEQERLKLKEKELKLKEQETEMKNMQTDPGTIPRPIGRKKAKSIASGSGGSASVSASPYDEIGRAMIEQLRAFNLQEQERLKLKEKELKLKEQETEMKVMQTDPGTIPRPIGRKKAKSIASGSGGSASVSASPGDEIGRAMVEQLRAFNLQEQERLKLKEKELKLKEQETEMKVMQTDPGTIPRPIGRKKAKSIASGSGGSASVSASPRDEIGRAMVEQLRAFNLQEQERLKLKEKELKLKEQETEMKVMQTDPGTIPRPIGRKKAKSIASGSGGSASVSASPYDEIGRAMVEQLWAFNLQEQERLKLKEKKLKLKEQETEMKTLRFIFKLFSSAFRSRVPFQTLAPALRSLSPSSSDMDKDKDLEHLKPYYPELNSLHVEYPVIALMEVMLGSHQVWHKMFQTPHASQTIIICVALGVKLLMSNLVDL
ncbi:unnamed protein product [Cuscuta campestris]|uniref:No apical meristem-associated C-terminal domain-containing protein n=1 Tax=Cuscuta campestris TaxID=132261 RepID=A0A484NJP0_9ASTE|nr:unnamed protein product [Cuscuta campestris]